MLAESTINLLRINPWIQLGLILALPIVLQYCAHWLFYIVDQHASQFRHNDSESTGSWLKKQATKHPQLGGLSVFPQTTMLQAVDGYWPSINAVVLSHTTYNGYRKRDRHVAAHELGHAVLHNHYPTLGKCLALARVWLEPSGLLILAYVAMMLANINLNHWVYECAFFSALTAHALVLFDEAYASIFAYRHLKNKTDLQPIRTHLFAAWTVYFLPFVGLCCQYAVLQQILSEPESVALPNTDWLDYQAIPFLCVLSVMLLKRCRTVLGSLMRRDSPNTLGEYELSYKRTLAGEVSGGLGALLFCVFTMCTTQVTAPAFAYWLAFVPGCIPAQKMGRGLIHWLMAIVQRPFSSKESDSEDPRTAKENPANSLRLLAANAKHRKKTTWLHILFLPLLCIWWFKYLYTLAV